MLVLISAPSGGGKTTLCRSLLAAHPELTRVVTCTTRSPRGGERDGDDYYFLSEAEFRRKVEAGEFLEHALVYGQWYGTLRAEVMGKLEAGRDVLLNVDVQGARSIQAAAAADRGLQRALVTVFLTPASLAVLEQRLRGRGTEDGEVLRRRLGAAKEEIAEWRAFDYLLISESVGEDLRRLEVILEAERMRQVRSRPPRFEEVASPSPGALA
ncbi:MAG: guanylate kinase [Verrucomicrobia bacterium]|nr:guanylate kinase [Verrucomicrobiota bacterium]